jgi:hypothetical protein
MCRVVHEYFYSSRWALSPSRLTRNQIYCNFPYPITIMVITPLSEQTEITEEALSASVPNETSALLPVADGRVFVLSQRSLTEQGQSAISSFLDKNAGLLLVASSQFFFSASNVCVKWLNSLDESERVPILEVRDMGGN